MSPSQELEFNYEVNTYLPNLREKLEQQGKKTNAGGQVQVSEHSLSQCGLLVMISDNLNFSLGGCKMHNNHFDHKKSASMSAMASKI